MLISRDDLFVYIYVAITPKNRGCSLLVNMPINQVRKCTYYLFFVTYYSQNYASVIYQGLYNNISSTVHVITLTYIHYNIMLSVLGKIQYRYIYSQTDYPLKGKKYLGFRVKGHSTGNIVINLFYEKKTLCDVGTE